MTPRGDAQLQGRYWPEPAEPPRLADGTVDVRALCAQWDAAVNDGAATGPSAIEEVRR